MNYAEGLSEKGWLGATRPTWQILANHTDLGADIVQLFDAIYAHRIQAARVVVAD
jgi:hypothetical protein